jgi:uncharacterized protein (DUF849 family)
VADRRIILTCAVTGGLTRPDMNPSLPVSPEQIADSCLEAGEAGAAIVHIHVRHSDGRQSMDVRDYRKVVDRIRAKNTALLINLTTGPGGRFEPGRDDPLVPGPKTNFLAPERRIEHIVALKPDIATLDLNTMNFGAEIVVNTPTSARVMAEAIYDSGVLPELEFFDTGDIEMGIDLIREGSLKVPCLACLVLGVKYGFAATAEAMLYAKSRLPTGLHWTGFGVGRAAYPMLAQSYILGGNVRIGMEDTVHVSRGQLTSGNGELVEKAASILESLGGMLASAEEARKILNLEAR